MMLCGAAYAAAMALVETTEAADRPPNVVLILVDDLGWADVGCYGSVFHETPHIDQLARQGMKFTQGYAACAVCSPTRASILTGRYPARIGVTDWIHQGPNERKAEAEGRLLEGFVRARSRKLLTPINGAFLPHEEVTLAEMLKPLGYVSCHIGKWHLGGSGWGEKSWLPTDQGFDFNIGGTRFGSPGSYYDPFPNGPTYPRTAMKARKTGEYLADREADEAVRFIRDNKDQPFFLYMAHYAVHAPIQPKKDLLDKYLKKPKTTGQRCPEYATMVESVDLAVGRILATLDELNLAENTIVIFTSDNGGASHVRCRGIPATDNSPLRLGKGFPYEGGVRVPFVFRWPGRIPAGTVCGTPICSIDLVPTICEAVGATLPKDRTIDGISLLPLLTQSGSIDRQALYWHFPHYWWGTNVRPYSIIRDGDWKLIRHYETGRIELYNLANDLGETNDMAESRPDLVRRLSAKLDGWLTSVGAKLPKPNPDYVESPAK
ncbi:MAG: sulfatase [Planctomycetes bacterium]|nr:sulfatase [Planctomycetota bacterium]